MKKILAAATGLIASAVLAAPALAHTGGQVSGLGAGLAHPLLGLDHLLTMVAVGVFSAVQPKGEAWRAPALFLAFLAAGAILGIAGAALPLVEPGILASVVGLGLAVLTARRLPQAVGLAAIAAFAVLHGHAHGTEAVGAVAGYMTGFLAASAALHLAGYGAGRALSTLRYGVPAAGLAFAAAGAALIGG